ncbi:hypothetical protein D3C80_849400 [compost metagenome]
MEDFKKLLDEAIASRAALYETIAPLNAQVRDLSVEIARLNDEQAKALDLSSMTRQEQIEYFLFEDGAVTGERYKRRQAFWRTFGVTENGYVPEINQVMLKITMYKGCPKNFDDTLRAVKEVLPFIAEVNGLKVIRIFEHSLSEDGRFELATDGTEFMVNRTYGRRTTSVKRSTDLFDVLSYIQDNHWYEVKGE